MLLLIDSYDSFSGNLRRLLETASRQKVVAVQNDQLTAQELIACLPGFDAVVVGPGPGHPETPADVGVIPTLFSEAAPVVPILGVCLGFQSLCLSAGSPIERSSSVRHGQIYKIHHTNSSIFAGVPQDFDSVRYHSLCCPSVHEDSLETLATTQDGEEEVLMAVKHTQKPWFGVQYHPESICSSNGELLVKNFVQIATEFNKEHRTIRQTDISRLLSASHPQPLLSPSASPYKLHQHTLTTQLTPLQICDYLHQLNREFILLNSASSPGEWSIIGLPTTDSLQITHSTETADVVTVREKGATTEQKIRSIWEFVSEKMISRMLPQSSSGLPFVGGFMGIFSYEEGHHITLDKLPKLTSDPIPDTKLVFIEHCLVINNSSNTCHIVSLLNDTFITDMASLLTSLTPTEVTHLAKIPATQIDHPSQETYSTLFSQCQSFLHSGDSYELCLTVPTSIHIPKELDAWTIYKTLTTSNPSPYSAYFHFDDCVLLSSSPERFLSWNKDKCQLRPIKGTVRKTQEMTREKATQILNTPKELGENLMIVDLIRHDLYQLLDDVQVTKLMSVEEYKTVYQLVSVIEGKFDGEYSGIDVLSKALPPGSMTGAPKRRSVEILQELEASRRGLYSGVCGYWSVEDVADWSVIIRSIFHYKADLNNSVTTNLWRIGAGGAITVLSDVEGEWEEMLTKLDSALSIFSVL